MAFEDRPYYREGGGFPGGGVRFNFPPFTPLTLAVMGACLLVFIVQAATGARPAASPLADLGDLSFHRALAFIQPWRWITYQYLHAGGLHLFFNMLVLYFFLPQLERRWGWARALAFYTVGGIVAGATYGLMTLVLHFPGGLIGASGSVLATLGACAYLYPDQRVLFLFFPVPIRVLTGLLAVLYLLTVFGDRDLSDAAHLGGLAFGFIAPWLGGPLWNDVHHNLQRRRSRRAVQMQRTDEQEVDRILQKVHDQGLNSVTRRERNLLRRATERQRIGDIGRIRRP